jgi:hypothetical protein
VLTTASALLMAKREGAAPHCPMILLRNRCEVPVLHARAHGRLAALESAQISPSNLVLVLDVHICELAD